MRQVLKASVLRWRIRIYDLLESDEVTSAARLLRLFIGLLILANVVAVVAESHSDFYKAYRRSLGVFNAISVVLFTIEYLLRVWVSVENPKFSNASAWRARLTYMRSPWGVIDFAAIAPFYLGSIVSVDLRHLRALRLLRLLKLSRHFKSLEIFWHVIRTQTPILLGATLVILILLMLSSTLMYLIESQEQPKEFGNISKAMWWSIVTLTSVGYGDAVPSTPIGKVMGGFIMFLGVGLVALPAAILAGKFADELQIRRERVERLVVKYLQDGKLDDQEGKIILERGKREGLTEEQTKEIADHVHGGAGQSRACPRCGYSES